MQLAPGIPEQIASVIRGWGIGTQELSHRVWEILEQLDDNPNLGQPDPTGLYAGIYFYKFVVDQAPLVFRGAIGYDVYKDDDTPRIRVTAFRLEPRRE